MSDDGSPAAQHKTISRPSNLIVSAPSIISIKPNMKITTVEQSKSSSRPRHDRIIAHSTSLGLSINDF